MIQCFFESTLTTVTHSNSLGWGWLICIRLKANSFFFHKETIRKENTFQPLFKNASTYSMYCSKFLSTVLGRHLFESLFWQVHLNSDEAWTHYEAETLWRTLESVSYSTSSSSTTEEGSDTGELYFGALWPTRNKLPFLIWEVNGRINPQM